MGCLCSKGISSNDYLDNLNRNKEINKSSRPLAVASIREDEAETGENGGFDQALEGLMYKKASEENSLSERVLLKQESIHPDIEEKNIAEAGKITNLPSNQFQLQLPRSSGVPNGTQGEQVAAGWPAWLAAVAGEAITGWIPRKAESFEKLDKIGQGTYSSVYRGRDVETGKTVAMKKVRFVNMDPESVRFMAREVIILRRLDHPNVMKLEGVVTSRVSGSVYLIFPYMEHDLAGLAAMSGIRFTEAQIKCYMQQLLRGLEHCHDRGVLHRDIKGSNLLIDDDGKMKIGDFGLSTFFEADQKKPLTSRVVTLWYRPPELLLGSTDYGPGVDLWSAGCILAELFYGKPIMPGRTEVEQLHKIFKLCGSPSEEYWRKSKLPHATIFKPQNPYRRCAREVFSDFPESALELLDVLLAIEPEKRCSASSVLQHEFLTSVPLPCSPSHLPKYPPSKEFDAKLRDEGARRKKTAAAAAAGKHHRGISATSRNASHDPKGMPAARDANAESAISVQIQKRNNKKRSVEEDSHNKEVGVGRSGLSNSVAVRGSSSSVNEEVSTSSSWSNPPPPPPPPPPDDNKHEWFRALLDAPKSSSSRKKTRPVSTAAMRVHYSGPLLPPGGNLEEALKEHEKQVQQAMRRARVGRTKAAPNAAAHRDSSLLRNPRVATRGGR